MKEWVGNGLPLWVKEIYPHQVKAIDEIIEAFKTVDVVILEAPTGSGKTLIGEVVGRELEGDTLYVCNNKQLQDQFARDFPYAKVLKGRSNYPTQYSSDHNCDECVITKPGDECWFCDSKLDCPYEIAKTEALAASLAVINTNYFLTEANYVGRFGERDFVIIDEADTLENILSGFVEYNVSSWLMRELTIQPPVKGARRPVIIQWLKDLASATQVWLGRQKNMEPKRIRGYLSFINETHKLADELQEELDRGQEEGEDKTTSGWVRIYEDSDGRYRQQFKYKPVKVDNYGTKYLWRHGKKFLIMSATIISPQEIVDSLGIEKPWKLVTVPMLFPAENRPIVLAPVANVIYSERDRAIKDLTTAIVNICENHPDERILVHTVSYWLTKELAVGLKQNLNGRPIVSYEAGGQSMSLRQYEAASNAVLLAPSMDRGIDFKDDLCRVVIVAKVPYLSLADRTVSTRQRLPFGNLWYAVQAIRTIIQMTGRGVRSVDDHATTYILDRQFAGSLFRQYKSLFPGWWTEALDKHSDIRWISKPLGTHAGRWSK